MFLDLFAVSPTASCGGISASNFTSFFEIPCPDIYVLLRKTKDKGKGIRVNTIFKKHALGGTNIHNMDLVEC